MRRFRGLRRRLPITCWTFAIGGLSLAGIVPLAGFWSKDEILTALKLAARHSRDAGLSWGPAYGTIYWIALLTAMLTAFYTGRAFFLTFFGPEKLPSPDDPEAEPADAHAAPHPHPAMPADLPAAETGQLASYEAAMRGAGPGPTTPAAHASHADPHRPADLPRPTPGASDEPVPQHGSHDGHGHGHDDHFGHESPPVMTWPLIVLAVGTLVVGWLFGPGLSSIGLSHPFEHHVIGRTPGFERLGHLEHGTDWASIGLGTGAGLLGLVLSYLMYAAPSPLPGRLARSLRPLYEASYRKFGVDEFYNAVVVAPTRALAWLSRVFDEHIVDGLVRLTAWVPRFVGRDLLAPLQGGLVQLYAWTTALGVVLLLLFLMFYRF